MQPSLFDQMGEREQVETLPPDQAARQFAIDPSNHVVLEASAGTGKTRVLVDRYVRLLMSGVDPRHILAMTFTRKAAAEMRERVLGALHQAVERGQIRPTDWQALRERMNDVQITTIDGFCFSLLREFPLEADVDPAFEVADETEMARFTREALDITLGITRSLVDRDEAVRLLLVRVKQPVLREALALLIDRRQVAVPAVARFVSQSGAPADGAAAARRFVGQLARDFSAISASALIDDGPKGMAEFARLTADLGDLDAMGGDDPVRVQHFRSRLEHYFLTKAGDPRKRLSKPYTTDRFATEAARRRHEQALGRVSPLVKAALERFDADLDRLLARGLLRVLTIARDTYERLLAENALVDFAGMLDRAVTLLARQEDFARSRLKLQARYHHLLIDEFQDTSRQQWRLIDLLIAAWAEGEGVADEATSVFIVGDRKQSIYRFRHAEVTLLDEAATRIEALRPDRPVRRAITTSFRAVPELLAFVNAIADAIASDADVPEKWRYDETDRFPAAPVEGGARRDGQPVVGLIAEPSVEDAATTVADEIVRLLDHGTVRDRETGSRPVRPEDIAILFRARAGHQYFEDALEARGIRSYVYKGLGFFDAPEVQDLQALLGVLARPESDLDAAAFLRSRFVRLSDPALVALTPDFAAHLVGTSEMPALPSVDAALLTEARRLMPRWLKLAAEMPPGELIDLVVRESAYACELGDRRIDQARENVKKVRSLVRRVESRGYATLDRLASYFDTLRAGDDSNAIVEAEGAVNLMTIHAAKGLERPIVFVVNLQMAGRGRAAGFSVIERGADGEPTVAFSSSDATKLEDVREAEELRRLFYVAITRARDRLYLASEVTAEGRFKRSPRSLAGLLPTSLANAFVTARGTDRPEVEWETGHGTFALAACRRAATTGMTREAPPPVITHETGVVAIAPVRLAGHVRRPVTAEILVVPLGTRPGAADMPSGDRDDRLVGTLVHRLFQRRIDDQDDGAVMGRARALVTAIERVDLGDPEPTLRAAVALYQSMRRREDVVALLGSGACYYEVPFSYFPPDTPGEYIRGVVDCLVVAPDGRATVLEFKTGHPRPQHERQVAVYARAMAVLLARDVVDTKLCYP